MIRTRHTLLILLVLLVAWAQTSAAMQKDMIYSDGHLQGTTGTAAVSPGDPAPDFELPSLTRGKVRLSDYEGKKNVLLSFVPAAWTPVCSDQWPGYNIAKEFFDQTDTIILGITVDNLPTQHAWVKAMGGLWFPVLSDFWPHGRVAELYGILRPEGVAERALILVDKKGVVRYVDVHEINKRPDLGVLVRELEKLE